MARRVLLAIGTVVVLSPLMQACTPAGGEPGGPADVLPDPTDVDGDGTPNDEDPDIDGDGTPNLEDPDLDGDGLPNASDGDIDGDAIANASDPDLDGDGIPNASDDDIDGDGTTNNDDTTPRGAPDAQIGPEGDVDADGIANVLDDDDDGDGIADGVSGIGSCGDVLAADEDSDCDGFCHLIEFGFQPCDDGAPPGSGRPDSDGDGIPDPPVPPIDPPDPNDPADPGLDCGHIDVDTSHLVYPASHGSTDGHVHEYDDRFDVTGFDAFDTRTTTLSPIGSRIPDPSQRFKIIVSNSALSPGARIVVNQTYDAANAATYRTAPDYAAIPVAQLPVFSLDGTSGTTRLSALGIYFSPAAIADRAIHPTNTRDVRGNTPGAAGEARNGALILQAVAVDDTGTDAFTTDTGLGSGGVQGVATSGLLYEITVFWHWRGPSYDAADWATYDPAGDLTCIP